MGKLWEIVREHIDSSPYPPSERQVAKRLGISPTALANWRSPKSLPGAANLRSLSRLTGEPYVRVLRAALEDTGYLKAASGPVSGSADGGADPGTGAVRPVAGVAAESAGVASIRPEDLDLAAYAAPAGGTELEQWDREHASDGEDDQDTGGDEPA